MDERTAKLAGALAELGADWALLTSVDAVAWATGHFPVIEAGSSPFAGGPTLALVGRDGTTGLVHCNVEAAAAAVSRADLKEPYIGFAWAEPADYAANHAAALQFVLAGLGVGGVLAVEPATLTRSVDDLLPAGPRVNLTMALRRARMVKTEPELEALRRAAQAAAAGHEACRTAARPGRTELEVFADIRLAMETLAGERMAVTGDFLSGVERTAGFTGWPVARTLEAGDPVLADLAPRLGGYWGDSCAAFTLGPASPAFERQWLAAKAALDHALRVARPGLTAAQLDAEVRAVVAAAGYAYPHHSGHSIGTAVHEFPRLVPWDDTPLEAGMVLMCEPGAYSPEGGGVRLEWMLEVTATGCRPMFTFDHVLAVPV